MLVEANLQIDYGEDQQHDENDESLHGADCITFFISSCSSISSCLRGLIGGWRIRSSLVLIPLATSLSAATDGFSRRHRRFGTLLSRASWPTRWASISSAWASIIALILRFHSP